jgi:hypothetical protein
MSREQTVAATWIIDVASKQPDGSWRIYARPSGTIGEKDYAERSLQSFCLSGGQVVIVGSLVLKPPASSGPPGDSGSARRDTPQGEPAGSTSQGSSWLRSTLERELVQSVVQVYDRQRTRDGLTWSEVFSIARQVLSAKL